MISFIAGHRAQAGSSLMRSIIIFFASLGCAGVATAQQQFYFKNLTERDGLSNNSVTCFLQDSTGFMWIGTKSGLNRFNGNSWSLYQPGRDKRYHISNGFITALKQDKNGRIWAATRRGLNCIDPLIGRTEVYLPKEGDPDAMPSDLIWDVEPARDGGIWIAPDAKDFCYYDPDKKKLTQYDFRHYVEENHLSRNPKYHSIFRIIELEGGSLLLATTDGIFLYDSKSHAYTLIAPVPLNNAIYSRLDKLSKRVFFVDADYQMVEVDLTDRKWRTSKLRNISLSDNKKNSASIFDEIVLPAAKGLATIAADGKAGLLIEGSYTAPYQLLPGNVQSIYTDRQGIAWVGTENGVSRFIPSFNKALHVTLPNIGSYLVPPSVKNISFNPVSKQWLVAIPGRNQLLGIDDQYGYVTEWQRPNANDTCYSFFLQGRDSLFLLGRGVIQLYSFNQKTWNRIKLPKPFDRAMLQAMALDASGQIWLVSQSGSLFKYDPVTKTVTSFAEEKIGSLNNCLAFDAGSNCMWIGTTGYGLFRYNFATDKFFHIEADLNNEKTLPSFIINDLLVDGSGNLWIASFEGGLSKYKTSAAPETGFTNYSSLNGLRDNNVYGLSADANGGVWFSTIKGIGHINSGNKIKWFNEETGLPVSAFNRGLVALPSGSVASVTGDEFIRFQEPRSGDLEDCPMVIQDVYIHDTLHYSVMGNREVDAFDYTDNTFTFHFATLDYSSPEAIRYTYMLEGFDKDWVNAGGQHTVRFANLEPGTYQFKVKALTPNGQVYPSTASWQFTIAPPFWETGIFRTLLIVGLLGLLYALFRNRLKVVRKEAALRHRIAETEMMALRAQMNPHFIFNCLNSIESLIGSDQKEKATQYLSKFARLIRSILEHAKSNAVPIWKDVEVLKLYISLEELRFSGKFTWELRVDPALQEGDFKVPPLVVQPFVENAIHHGLLNKRDDGGRLLIDVSLHDDQIVYRIEDNGVGREQSASYLKHRESMQHSMGLDIAMDRIRLFNRATAGGVSITDLKDADGKACGTRVDVTLVNPS